MTLRFNGKSVQVQDAENFDWTQAQLAFFVAGPEASARYVDDATNAGCLVIDSSGLFALEPDVPLVVPDVNPYVLADYRNRNVVAVADSLTSQLLTALRPLMEAGGLSRIQVTNLLAASAQGKAAVDALAGQSARLLNGMPVDDDDHFGRQLAFNVLPLLPDREGSVRQDRRLVNAERDFPHRLFQTFRHQYTYSCSSFSAVLIAISAPPKRTLSATDQNWICSGIP